MAYRGETDAKRVARFYAYTIVGALWEAVGRRVRGMAVGLAGDDAADVPLMRILGYPDQKIALTDIRDEAIRTTRSKYPEVLAYKVDVSLFLEEAASQLRQNQLREHATCIDFLCLDLCGHVDGWAKKALEAWARQARWGSVAAVTYLGARETKRNAYLRYQNRKLPKKRRGKRHHMREMAVWSAIGDEFVPVGRVSYNSGRSPMRTVVFARYPEYLLKHKGWRFESIDIKKHHTPKKEFLSRAHIWSPRDAADSFNLPMRTVVAWKAHATMGTYRAKGTA